jgi:hypothetical protein
MGIELEKKDNQSNIRKEIKESLFSCLWKMSASYESFRGITGNSPGHDSQKLENWVPSQNKAAWTDSKTLSAQGPSDLKPKGPTAPSSTLNPSITKPKSHILGFQENMRKERTLSQRVTLASFDSHVSTIQLLSEQSS